MSWVWEHSRSHYLPPVIGRTAPVEYSKANIYAIAARDGWTCAYCGNGVEDKTGPHNDDPAKPQATVDHVVPRCLGGGDTNRNGVLACGPCNSRKGARHPATMFEGAA